MRIRLDLDEAATVELVKRAVAENRSAPVQAEAVLREALGLPIIPDERGDSPARVDHTERNAS